MSVPLSRLKDQMRTLVRQALDEDLGSGDVTEKFIPASNQSQFYLRAREPGVFCGAFVAAEVFRQAGLKGNIQECCRDGEAFEAGQTLQIYESISQITLVERVLLNVIQHFTAIASETARWVELIRGTSCQIYDTRKTTPGWRFLEKFAVTCGGGKNHRLGLYDAVMIKDNHLARAGVPKDQDLTSFVSKIVDESQVPVFIEVESLKACLAVAQAEPDVILLDNMSCDEMSQCVEQVRILKLKSYPQLEASGGITKDNVKKVALTGVDRISIGALTQNPPRIDLGLDDS